MLSIDGTFLVQILNFIVFWILLNWLFIRPTRRAIEARRQYVAKLYDDADAFGRQATALQAEADGILGAARRQTDEMMRQASAQASQATHEIERGASEEAAATVQLAHATVASERSQALSKQQSFVQELARSMVEKATGFPSEQVA